MISTVPMSLIAKSRTLIEVVLSGILEYKYCKSTIDYVYYKKYTNWIDFKCTIYK